MSLRQATFFLVRLSVALAAAVLPAQAANRAWTGAGASTALWSDAANWGGTAPVGNDALCFTGTRGLTNTNDAPQTIAYNSLTFTNGAGAFALNGNPIILNAGLTNNSSQQQTINLALQLGRLAVCAVNGGDVTLNQLNGPGSLTKTGPGTLRLLGPVSSGGPLTVNAGTVSVDGTVAAPASVTVNSGGTLAGMGLITPDLLIADGGTLSPGKSDHSRPGTLTCSNLVIQPNAILRFDLNVPGVIGATNDLLVVHGNLSLDGILKISGKGPPGLYPLIKYDGALIDNGMQLGSSVTGTLMVDTTNKLISVNASSFPAAAPAPMRVLFIGNSLLFTYDIPGTLQQLANAAGDWFTYGSDLEGGTTLSYHITNQITVPMIDSGAYDLVMLQEYSNRSTIPNDRDNQMYPAARLLNSHILSHGERTLFYETWGYPYGDPGNCQLYDTPAQYRGCSSTAMLIAVRMGYARIADELSAAISPVGLAWLTAMSQRPDINLYYDTAGNYHPGPTGAYLATCVHYASIFGRTPVGIPYNGQVPDASVASYLQGVAEQTVFQDPWACDPFGFTSNRFYWASSWAAYTNQAYSRLNGLVISGSGGLPSPSVRLDVAAGQTNNVYLGVYGYNYESAGQGRLYVRPGGSLTVATNLVVGKEGQGWIQQSGGAMQVNGVLGIAEQPSSSGSYTLAGGTAVAAQMTVGQAGQGSVTQQGGSARIIGPFLLAEQPSSSGSYMLADGTVVAAQMTVGQAGQASVTQQGGSAQILGPLTLADQPSSSGVYSLLGGSLSATCIARGQGNGTFTQAGGQLSFAQLGTPAISLDLSQSGGVFALTNPAAIFGNYTLRSAGALNLVLGMSNSPLLAVSGTASLGGTLGLSFAPGFVPVLGQQYPLVTAGDVSGVFAQVLKPGLLPGGSLLVVTYTPTSVVAMVTSPVPTGLVGWWPGDGSADDLAGTSDGMLFGGATANAGGVVGSAFSFDGATGYVQIPNAPALNPANLTLECWVRFTGLDSAGSGGSPPGDQYIVFKQNSRSGNFEGYDLSKTRAAGGDTFRFLISSAAGQSAQVVGATLVTTGAWYHVAAVRGSNYMQLYVNGQLERQAAVSFAQDYGVSPLYFGTSGTYWDHKLNGLLDEVSLYNRALSSSEVAAIYGAGPAGKCRAAAVTILPQNQSAPAGFGASFAADALGPVRAYQWLFNHTNVLVGATNSALSLSNLKLYQSGDYSVIASNATGVVVSDPVSLVVTPVAGILMPIEVSGSPGSSWRIDYLNDLGPTNTWTPLATVTLTNTSQVYIDASAINLTHRFYRLVPLP